MSSVFAITEQSDQNLKDKQSHSHATENDSACSSQVKRKGGMPGIGGGKRKGDQNKTLKKKKKTFWIPKSGFSNLNIQ